jgi:hypothetical protein
MIGVDILVELGLNSRDGDWTRINGHDAIEISKFISDFDRNLKVNCIVEVQPRFRWQAVRP